MYIYVYVYMLGDSGDCAYMRLEYEVEGHRSRSSECAMYGGFDLYIYVYVYIYIYIYICGEEVVIVHI